MRAMPEVEDCWRVAGSEGYVLKVRVTDIPALEATIGALNRIRGVARTRTTVVLSTKWEGVMADTPEVPPGPTGGPATPPKVLPVAGHVHRRPAGDLALLTLVLWMFGLDFFSGLLFGLLLSMAVSYFALRFARDRLNEALAARSTGGARPRRTCAAGSAGSDARQLACVPAARRLRTSAL